MGNLRTRTIRLAHRTPALRPHLLPILASVSRADALLDELADLADLDSALTAIEESFAVHYRTASEIRPEIVSHHDALKKAKGGLDQAQKILASAQLIADTFPDDKTAKRAVADANTMVARFTRHLAEGRKIVRTIAQKQMPPALKKAAEKVKAAVSKIMVDPSQLQVIPWAVPHQVKLSLGSMRLDTVLFKVVFRIENAYPNKGVFEFNLQEDPVGEPGVKFEGERVYPIPVYTGPEQALDYMRRGLVGWPGLKGEIESAAARAPVANAVARALESALSRMNAWKTDPVQVNDGGRTVEAAYRSNLPKEGSSEVGEYMYEKMVQDEIAAWRRVLDPYLAPHMKVIQNVSIHDGEKSWIYTRITLK